MNTSIGLHIRSTSGVSRDNHRIKKFLKNCEVHMQKVLYPNSTARRVLFFRAVKQRAKYRGQYLSNGLLVKTLHDAHTKWLAAADYEGISRDDEQQTRRNR
jgi:hypothetical protein